MWGHTIWFFSCNILQIVQLCFQDTKDTSEDKIKHPPDKTVKKSPKNIILPPADSKNRTQNKNLVNENKKEKSENTEKSDKEKDEKLERIENKYERTEKHEKIEKPKVIKNDLLEREDKSKQKYESSDKEKLKERVKEQENEREKQPIEHSSDDRTISKLEGQERTESKQEKFLKDKGDVKDKSEEFYETKEDKRDSSLSFKDSSSIPPIHHQPGHNVNTTSSNAPTSIPSLSRWVYFFSFFQASDWEVDDICDCFYLLFANI